jgi:sec-independent protein translocase protein TatA
MGSMSLIHWIIVGAVLLLLFGGKNKISDVMGDVAKGIKSFKKGLSEDDDAKAVTRPADPVRSIDHYPQAQAQPQTYPVSSAQPVATSEAEARRVG